jgi:hypothetical protein
VVISHFSLWKGSGAKQLNAPPVACMEKSKAYQTITRFDPGNMPIFVAVSLKRFKLAEHS